MNSTNKPKMKKLTALILTILLTNFISAKFSLGEITDYADSTTLILLLIFAVSFIALFLLFNKLIKSNNTTPSIIALLLSAGITYGVNKIEIVNNWFFDIEISETALYILIPVLSLAFIIFLIARLKEKSLLVLGGLLLLISFFVESKEITIAVGTFLIIVWLLSKIKRRARNPRQRRPPREPRVRRPRREPRPHRDAGPRRAPRGRRPPRQRRQPRQRREPRQRRTPRGRRQPRQTRAQRRAQRQKRPPRQGRLPKQRQLARQQQKQLQRGRRFRRQPNVQLRAEIIPNRQLSQERRLQKQQQRQLARQQRQVATQERRIALRQTQLERQPRQKLLPAPGRQTPRYNKMQITSNIQSLIRSYNEIQRQNPSDPRLRNIIREIKRLKQQK